MICDGIRPVEVKEDLNTGEGGEGFYAERLLESA